MKTVLIQILRSFVQKKEMRIDLSRIEDFGFGFARCFWRKKVCRTFSFLVSLSVLISINTDAQPQKYTVYDFGSKLSKDLIKGIASDQQGYVWSATDKGVVRFDGQRSVFFKNEIPGGFAKALTRSTSDRMLVLHDFGLTEIHDLPDSLVFQTLMEGIPEDTDSKLYYPKTIFIDGKKRVWIGENQSVVLFDDGHLKKYRIGNNQEFGVLSRSFSFAENAGGTLWCLSHSGQLFYFDETEGNFIQQNLGRNLEEAACMVTIEGNLAWIGMRDGVIQVELQPQNDPLPVEKIGGPDGVSIGLIHNDNDFFVGTWNDGLYYTNISDASHSFQKIEKLPFNDVVGLSSDQNNGLWATGKENTVLLKTDLFDQFDLGTANRPSITSLSLTPNGNILVIGDENETNKQAIYELENGYIKWQSGFAEYPFENIPLSAFNDGMNVWVGGLSGSIYNFDKNNLSAQKRNDITNSNSPISKITKDSKNNIWIAGNINHGLIKIDQNGESAFFNEQQLIYSKVIYSSPNGELFAGGKGKESYLYKFNYDKNLFENLSPSINEKINIEFEVKDIIADQNNDLFLSTTDGVFNAKRVQDDSFFVRRMDLKKIPRDEPSNALAISPDGTLWVATTSGLVAYNEAASFLFDKSSGLAANSFTDMGLVFDDGGNLWVGTAYGLSIFNNEKSDFRITPKPIIEKVIINVKRDYYHARNNEVLPYNAGIEFEFISLSFPVDQVIYKTRLIGLDSSWSESGFAKQWYVNGLAPGSYTFEVIAQQQEGMKWSRPASFSFNIDKPWYLRAWAIIPALFLSIALIYFTARIYNLRLIKQKKKLESVVKKRTDEVNRQKNEIIEQQKQIIEQNKKMQKLKEEQYKNELEYKNKQLTTYTLNLIQKNQSLKELRLKINQVIRSSSKSSYQEMRKLINLIDYSFRKDEDWDNFKLYFEEVHVGFFESLIQRHSKLTSLDLRHCALIRLNLTIEEMATIVGISSDSIKTARFRLKRKMNLDSKTDLLEYLMSI